MATDKQIGLYFHYVRWVGNNEEVVKMCDYLQKTLSVTEMSDEIDRIMCLHKRRELNMENVLKGDVYKDYKKGDK